MTNYPSNSVGPGSNAFSVTPSDSADLDSVTRGIYVGATGDLKVTMMGGGVVTFVSLVAGVIHPIMAQRIWSTGTTATDIVGVV